MTVLGGTTSEVKTSIDLIEPGRDEIFLACASFEDRTTAVANKLSQQYLIENSFVCKYEEKNKSSARDENFERLRSLLARHSGNVFPIICDHHDVLDGIRRFRELCSSRGVGLADKNISVDITTFTKQYLLVLLKYLEKQHPRSVRLLYTEPEDYAVKWDRPLSCGLIDIVSVPTYGGRSYTEKENLLILILGYEGDRAYGIWERLSPHKTVVIVGRPSYKNLWEGRVEQFNSKLLAKLPSESTIYSPTLDPFQVKKDIDTLVERHSTKFNIAISPLGSKPQVIGCYLSLAAHAEVQVIYAIPKYHEEEYFSKRTGRMWEYR